DFGRTAQRQPGSLQFLGCRGAVMHAKIVVRRSSPLTGQETSSDRPFCGMMPSMGYEYSRGWRALTIVVVPPIMRSLFRRQWQGMEHVPRQGGLIVAANHISEADPLVLCHYLHASGRYPVFLAKSSLFNGRLVGPPVRGTGQIPVYRDAASAGAALKPAE